MDLYSIRKLANNIKRILNEPVDVKENKKLHAFYDIPCKLDKTYYYHIRRYVPELSNRGGATIAFRVKKDYLADEPFYVLEYTWSQCNLKEKDQFCKKTGRELCDKRLNDLDVIKPFIEIIEDTPTIIKTKNYVIDEYMETKVLVYPQVYREYW